MTELFLEIRRLEMKGYNLFKETACIKRIKEGRLSGECRSDWLMGETVALLQIWMAKGKWKTLLFNQLLSMCLELMVPNPAQASQPAGGGAFRVPLMMLFGQLEEKKTGGLSEARLMAVIELVESRPEVNMPQNLYALLSIFERVDDLTDEGLYSRLVDCMALLDGHVLQSLGLTANSMRQEFMIKLIVFFKKHAIHEDNRSIFLLSWLALKCITFKNAPDTLHLKALQLFGENVACLLDEFLDSSKAVELVKGVVDSAAELKRIVLREMDTQKSLSATKYKAYRLKKHASVEKKREDSFETDFQVYKKQSRSREKHMKSTNYKKLMFNDQNYSFFKAAENNLVSDSLEKRSLTRTESAGLLHTKSIYGSKENRGSARLKERPSITAANSLGKGEGNSNTRDRTKRQDISARTEAKGSKSMNNLYFMETTKRAANNKGEFQHQTEMIKVGDLKSFIKVVKHEANRQFTHGEASLDNTVFEDIKVKTELDRNKLDWKSLKYREIRSESQGLKVWKPTVVALQIDQVLKEGINALTPRPVYPKKLLTTSNSKNRAPKVLSSTVINNEGNAISIQDMSNKKKPEARKDMSVILESELVKEEEAQFPRPDKFKKKVTQVMNAFKMMRPSIKNQGEGSVAGQDKGVENQAKGKTPPMSNFFKINVGDLELPSEKIKALQDSESVLNSLVSEEAKENSMEAILNVQNPDHVHALPPKIIILPEEKKGQRKLDMSLRVSKIQGGDVEIYKVGLT